MVVGDLQAKVDDFGLFYPPDPSSKKFCTIGGISHAMLEAYAVLNMESPEIMFWLFQVICQRVNM